MGEGATLTWDIIGINERINNNRNQLETIDSLQLCVFIISLPYCLDQREGIKGVGREGIRWSR